MPPLLGKKIIDKSGVAVAEHVIQQILLLIDVVGEVNLELQDSVTFFKKG